MWDWLVANKQWVFDGFGVAIATVALSVLIWLIKKFWSNREAAALPSITQAPITSVNPVIDFKPTINVGTHAPEPPKPSPPTHPIIAPVKVTPNLRVETTKRAKARLELDKWIIKRDNDRDRPDVQRVLLADISNLPTDDAHTAKAAVRAAIKIKHHGNTFNYSPLPWLDEFTNLVYIETGQRKSVVLAVGDNSPTGNWAFVLNHRADYHVGSAITEMDYSNPCPKLWASVMNPTALEDGLPFELHLIDMNSGAILKKFEYTWTFDEEENWPILEPRN
jgi:hypothetical protein